MVAFRILLIIIIVAIALFLILGVTSYNRFVTLRNRVDNAWSQIEVQLQRRLELIPNLVETVKGYAEHESKTLQDLTNARTAYMNASTPDKKLKASNQLNSTLKTLFAVSENYPDLMASANFRELQEELSDTEDKVSYMRQSYNDTVMKYNNAIQKMPGAFFANMFGFRERELFGASAAAITAPRVEF
jgi:LemA protein